MARHTTFKFCLDPTVEQQKALARHAGAARFAFNHCLRTVKDGLTRRGDGTRAVVPWTGFDLINAFNAWKKTADAGRVFTVDPHATAVVTVTGLVWRGQVCQQVFEEAAVDCGKALKAWSDSRNGNRRGRRVNFPRFKKKAAVVPSFRLRNKFRKGMQPAIRIGDAGRLRSVTVPGIGTIRVHDDTRRLRRMIAKERAKILFVTIGRRAGRWWISLNVEAADVHSAHRHSLRESADDATWVGVDRGLSSFVVAAAADGSELARITNAPKPLAAGMRKQRRLAKAVSRKHRGSNHHRFAAARLGRHHHHVAAVRSHFLHQVSNTLVKTHDRLVIEDLNVAGMLTNHRLARVITDASWAEFARRLRYKQMWRGGVIATADRWYPSSRICSGCGTRTQNLALATRTYHCGACGLSIDRDLNAATNLARWAKRTPDPQAGGRATNARRQARSGRHRCDGETGLIDAGTDVYAAPAT
ncbi:RNA-guided endonuclease TnpB family protein [Nocardia rhizosphaerihabitans]|uniref:RNA-guided endonuclease TnpB family protein n=1 Tax=Nocardia rhizosphaerihabitans TaxID=1691570 RepID=UPI00366DECA5